MKKRLRLIKFGLVLLLCGCASPGPRPLDAPDASRPDWPAPPAIPDSAQVYRVDPAESVLKVRVAPAGSLARLGHHHVIGGAVLAGQVIVDGAAVDAESRGSTSNPAVDLAIDVPSLEVDRPAWRRDAGFEPIDDDAVRGTRRNLLGPDVLDAERHPRIELRSVGVAQVDGDGAFEVTARARVRGAVTELRVPVMVEREAGRLIATGSFGVDQTALGMTPFSAAGGALRVADRIEIEFRIVGVAAVR